MHISHSIVMYGVIFCVTQQILIKLFSNKNKFNKNNDGNKSQKHM